MKSCQKKITAREVINPPVYTCSLFKAIKFSQLLRSLFLMVISKPSPQYPDGRYPVNIRHLVIGFNNLIIAISCLSPIASMIIHILQGIPTAQVLGNFSRHSSQTSSLFFPSIAERPMQKQERPTGANIVWSIATLAKRCLRVSLGNTLAANLSQLQTRGA